MTLTFTAQLASILFLGTVTVYLLHQLGKAVRNVRYYATTAHVMQQSLVMVYKTLDGVLSSAKDDYPEAVDAMSSDFNNRMEENLAKLEAEHGV